MFDNSVVTVVHIAIAYLSRTEEPSPWLEALSKNILEFKVSTLAWNAFHSLV